jgi:hypothetical protein
MPLHDHQTTTLKALGMTEAGIRDWIVAKPTRLGLGNVAIKDVEIQHSTKFGGRLDILAYDAALDTYYEVELMLGEVDADHGFRCLDYWARERVKRPNAKHVAVLVAEELSGRYKTLIETLPNFLPFIGIELRVLSLKEAGDVATVVPFIVAQPDDLTIDFGDEPESVTPGNVKPHLKDREWWESNSTPAYLATVDGLAKLCAEKIGPSSVDYTASSYISLKKGRRCWLPMWKRSNGAFVYLPGGPGGSADSPSDFYQEVKKTLQEIGLDEPSWTFKYNAGANPIGFAISQEKLGHSLMLNLLERAYEFA